LRNQASSECGNLRLKLSIGRIERHLPHAAAGARGELSPIDQDDFVAGRLRDKRTYHRGADLSRAARNQDANSPKARLVMP
jgi:hypothetical protein